MSFARNSLEKYLNAQPATLTQPTALIAATNTRFQLLQDYTLKPPGGVDSAQESLPRVPVASDAKRQDWARRGGAPGHVAGSLEQIAEAVSGHPGAECHLGGDVVPRDQYPGFNPTREPPSFQEGSAGTLSTSFAMPDYR